MDQRPVAPGQPGSPELERVLRQVVLDFVQREHRRVFPATLLVGRPGRSTTSRDLGPVSDRGGPGREVLDHAVRTDIVGAMLTRADPDPTPMVWLTRRGPLAPLGIDAPWVSAARSACGEADLPLVMVIVTRQGWLDPFSDRSRIWRRLRQR